MCGAYTYKNSFGLLAYPTVYNNYALFAFGHSAVQVIGDVLVLSRYTIQLENNKTERVNKWIAILRYPLSECTDSKLYADVIYAPAIKSSSAC